MKNIASEQSAPKRKVSIKIFMITLPFLLLIAGYFTALHYEMKSIRADGGYWGVVTENGSEKMIWKTLQ